MINNQFVIFDMCKSLKRVKKRAVDRNITLKELVNSAIEKYIREVLQS